MDLNPLAVRYPLSLAETRKLIERPKHGAFGSIERFLADAYEPKVVEKKDMGQYIVWTPDSDLPPKVVHDTRQAAIRAAGAMAHQNPGKTFFACKLVNSATKPIPVDVKYEDLDR